MGKGKNWYYNMNREQEYGDVREGLALVDSACLRQVSA